MLKMQDVSKVYRTELIETHALREVLARGRGRRIRRDDRALGLGQDHLPQRRRAARDLRHRQLPARRRGRAHALRRCALAASATSRIGFIFQSFNLIPDLDVYDNVDVPLRYRRLKGAERRERIEQRARARRARLAHAAHAVTALGRTAAARRDRARHRRRPALLLADEPTGNLDSLMARQVMDLLEQINELGTTIILVTHDPELARRAQRNMHIVDGQIVATPAPTSRRVPPDQVQAGAALAVRRLRSPKEANMIGYYLRLALRSFGRTPGDHDSHGVRDRARHRRLRRHAHRLSRDVRQPDLVEERPCCTP